MNRTDDTERFDDLPILEELRVSLADAYAAEERSAPAPARRPEARRRRWRWSRRALVAGAVAAVLVPSAVATRPIWSPAPDRFDPAFPLETRNLVILARGSGAEEEWRLSVTVRRDERCLAMRIETGGEGIGCDATVPGKRDLSVQFLSGDADGFVFGTTSSRVAEVRVRTATGETGVAKTQAPDAAMLRRGGVPADFRFYVVALPEPIDPTQGISVIASDDQGRPVDSLRPRAG